MADVKLKNGYVRIANTLLDQLFLREFTSKQIRIILFIVRLSYGYNKKYAVIKPKSRFNFAKIYRSDISNELKYLIDRNILIKIDKDSYSVNKNYDDWNIPYHKFYDEKKFKDLLALQFVSFQLARNISPELTKNEKMLVNNKQNLKNCLSCTNNNVSSALTENTNLLVSGLQEQTKNKESESNTTLPKDIIKDNIKTYIKDTYIGGEYKKSKSKIDPYFNNPIADYFKSEYKRISKKHDCYLDNSKLNKLLEISADYPAFKEQLPEILEKFLKITFPSGNKPSTKWLIIDGNWAGILNGEYDQYITDTTQKKDKELDGWTL